MLIRRRKELVPRVIADLVEARLDEAVGGQIAAAERFSRLDDLTSEPLGSWLE